MKIWILYLTMTTPWGAVHIFEAARFNPPIFGQDLCLVAGKRAAEEYAQRTLDIFNVVVDIRPDCRLADEVQTQ